MKDSKDDWVTVFTARDQRMLDQAKKSLNGMGIEYTIMNERFPDISFCGRMVPVSGFTGPPTLQVQGMDELQAKEALTEKFGKTEF